jgi:hypothetical protein
MSKIDELALSKVQNGYAALSGKYKDMSIREIIEAYEAAKPEQQTSREDELVGWQPIETAPKDGTKIIVYRPKADTGYIPHVGMDYWMKTSYGSYCWGKSRIDTKPTHWMPFPPSPTKTQDESNATNRRG